MATLDPMIPATISNTCAECQLFSRSFLTTIISNPLMIILFVRLLTPCVFCTLIESGCTKHMLSKEDTDDLSDCFPDW